MICPGNREGLTIKSMQCSGGALCRTMFSSMRRQRRSVFTGQGCSRVQGHDKPTNISAFVKLEHCVQRQEQFHFIK